MTDSKRTPAITAKIEGTVLTMAFADGSTITIDAANLSDDIRQQAMMHGIKQKVGDGAAISCNPETGRSATPTDKYNAALEIALRLRDGNWNKTREGGPTSSAGGILFRALCLVYATKTPEQIRATMESKTKEELAVLRKLPKVVAVIASLKPASADTESATAGFED